MKIALLEGIHGIAKENLESKGLEVELFKQSFADQELIDLLKNFDCVGIRSKTQMTEKVLQNSKHLTAIGCFCIGTNQVDLNSAKKLGIPVFNAPHSNTRSVAELVISEVVALSRNLFDMSMNVHKGVWQKSATGSFEVRGKTIGIVGYGHIGSQVSILAEAFGMKVLYYDVVKKLPLGNSQQTESLNELLQNSDFVTLHVPETPETKKMIGKKEISLMKDGACLLNLSRGTVVDIDALRGAIESEKIKGAAVDVYPSEPKKNSEGFQTGLQNCRNVILTPHIGGSTQEAQYKIGQEVSESLDLYISQGQTMGAVDFPNIQVSKDIRGRRLINVHRNVPGVLGDINSIVSKAGINIHSQMLSTDDEIGFLLMDIEKGHEQALDEISQLSTNIKSRLI